MELGHEAGYAILSLDRVFHEVHSSKPQVVAGELIHSLFQCYGRTNLLDVMSLFVAERGFYPPGLDRGKL